MAGGGRVVVTGGAGFVGSNLAHQLLDGGENVLVVDNLSRPSVERNLSWLQARHGQRLEVVVADLRDPAVARAAVAGATAVFHLAAQVAVTTGIEDPVRDFEVNARATLNLLEALRHSGSNAPVVFTSTNRVYGALPDLRLRRAGNRWEPEDAALRAHGISEERRLDFHSPYGSSNGAADQYVLDWARTYGLPAVVLRVSCIYGPRQHGCEDQGWVAHFMRRAKRREPVTIYGDGCQVRDVLFVEDLLDALLRARQVARRAAGRAFNVGGGPGRTLSLLELCDRLSALQGTPVDVRFAAERWGDQRWWVSDSQRFTGLTGWTPRVGLGDGLARLQQWIEESEAGRPARAAADRR